MKNKIIALIMVFAFSSSHLYAEGLNETEKHIIAEVGKDLRSVSTLGHISNFLLLAGSGGMAYGLYSYLSEDDPAEMQKTIIWGSAAAVFLGNLLSLSSHGAIRRAGRKLSELSTVEF